MMRAPAGARRHALIAAACSIAALAVVGGSIAAHVLAGGQETPGTKRPTLATASIERGTLQGSSAATGTLGFGGARTLQSGVGGVVTALPAPGARVGLGGALYSVDNQAVYLLFGPLPAWRPFESGMSDGPDVKALEESLRSLGHFEREPDEEFAWSTREAILRWQEATGQEQTGSIPPGRVEFAAGDVRIAEPRVAVGDRIGAGSPVVGVTDVTQLVNVDLRLADQKLGVVGDAVGIQLPDGAHTTGTVASVGVPTEKDTSGRTETVIPVVVSLDDPEATGALQQASVTVRFASERREDVLSVPVEALLALDGDRFGVEVVGDDGATKRMPVTTGLFAAGRVEISGAGISAGQRVVVPSS